MAIRLGYSVWTHHTDAMQVERPGLGSPLPYQQQGILDARETTFSQSA